MKANEAESVDALGTAVGRLAQKAPPAMPTDITENHRQLKLVDRCTRRRETVFFAKMS